MRLLIAVAVTFAIPAAVVAKDAKPVDPDKKTCRSQELAGTLFSKRVCHTAAEWARIDDQNRADARNFDDSRRNNSTPLK